MMIFDESYIVFEAQDHSGFFFKWKVELDSRSILPLTNLKLHTHRYYQYNCYYNYEEPPLPFQVHLKFM